MTAILPIPGFRSEAVAVDDERLHYRLGGGPDGNR